MPLTANQILRAAVVPGTSKRVYCIGSFARKVNFLAQQRRALNLVWALHEEGRLALNPRVAVIGGGLAGVTAAGALIAHGAKVDLFEKGGRVLHQQRKTSHRRVHPTINSWPHEPISVTTDLPFYDWAVGFCSEVAEDIAQHFEKAMEERGFKIYENVTVRDMSPIGTQLVRVVTDKDLEDIEGYEIVIITIGFGDEIKHDRFESKTYWANDNLEMERDGSGAAYQDFVVSGCGDGGLIDALRIVHIDFGEGLLAFELARKLSGTLVATAIERAEDSAAVGPPATAAKNLAKAYKKIARMLIDDPQFVEVHERLQRSMKKFNRIVYIGDNALAEPYSLRSAPIHKLMIAHVMETTGKIKFQPSEVTESVNGEVRLGQYHFDAVKTKVVIRHGAKTEFRNLLGDRDRIALKRKQERLKDRCAEPAWSDSYEYPTPPGWTADRSSRAYTRVRRDMAQRAFKLIIPDASVVDRPGKFRVDLEVPPPSDAPRTMFRVPVEYKVEAESPAL